MFLLLIFFVNATYLCCAAANKFEPAWISTAHDDIKTVLAHVSELQVQGMMNSADDWPTEATFSTVQSAIQDGVEDWDNTHLMGLITVIHSAVRVQKLFTACLQKYHPCPEEEFPKNARRLFEGSDAPFKTKEACIEALHEALSVKDLPSKVAPRNACFYTGWTLIKVAINAQSLPSIEESSRKDRTFKSTFIYASYLLDLMLTKRDSETNFCAYVLNFPPFIPYTLDLSISAYSPDDHQVAQKLSQVYLLNNSDTEHHACPFPTFGFACSEHSREYTPLKDFHAANTLSLFEAITDINFKFWVQNVFTSEPRFRQVISSFPQKFDILVLGRKSGKASNGTPIITPLPSIVIGFDIATDTVLALHAPQQSPNSIYTHGVSGPAILPIKLVCKFMPTSNRVTITPSDDFAFAILFRKMHESDRDTPAVYCF